MVARVRPGLAFWMVSDRGFAVGMVTHRLPRHGDIVWIARPFFDDPPTVEDVSAIREWRWPTLYAIAAAMRTAGAEAIGVVEVPVALRTPPLMRVGGIQTGWTDVHIVDDRIEWGNRSTDPSLPLFACPNTVALKERLVTGWEPQDEW